MPENQNIPKPKIYIYAPTVLSYGGLSLIQAIADSCDDDVVFILSKNAKMERLPKQIIRSGSGFFELFRLEKRLQGELNKDSITLALTNRPPFKKLPGYVITVLMSAYAIEIPDVPTSRMRKYKSQVQIWLNKFLKKNTDAFLARSQETVDITRRVTGWNTLYYPFMTERIELKRSLDAPRPRKESATFIYPADPQPHKNHKNLFAAFALLKRENIDAKLVITLSDKEAKLIDPSYASHNIEATGFVSEAELTERFKNADALIFPSLLESFSLPVIEARKFNLAIVASERHFVREQVDPEESFDPLSPDSIAGAVRRFVGQSPIKVIRPDAVDLLEYVVQVAQGTDPQKLAQFD